MVFKNVKNVKLACSSLGPEVRVRTDFSDLPYLIGKDIYTSVKKSLFQLKTMQEVTKKVALVNKITSLQKSCQMVLVRLLYEIQRQDPR